MSALLCGDMLIGDNGYRHVAVRKGKCGKPRLVRVSSAFAEVWREFFEWKRMRGEPTTPEAPVFEKLPQTVAVYLEPAHSAAPLLAAVVAAMLSMVHLLVRIPCSLGDQTCGCGV